MILAPITNDVNDGRPYNKALVHRVGLLAISMMRKSLVNQEATTPVQNNAYIYTNFACVHYVPYIQNLVENRVHYYYLR